MAKFIADKLPVQFVEYKKTPASQGRPSGNRKSSITPKLEFKELTEELKEIVDQVVNIKTKGKNLGRDMVYDSSL